MFLFTADTQLTNVMSQLTNYFNANIAQLVATVIGIVLFFWLIQVVFRSIGILPATDLVEEDWDPDSDAFINAMEGESFGMSQEEMDNHLGINEDGELVWQDDAYEFRNWRG